MSLRIITVTSAHAHFSPPSFPRVKGGTVVVAAVTG